jgi:S-DNA-T family DNA segregation ATPase FtsK/SpoIIIE
VKDTSPAPVLAARVPEKPWTLPPVDAILDPATPAMVQTHFDKDRARTIEETLASFGAPAHVVEIHRGPTITQFGVEPDFIETRGSRMRVRVSKIVSLADDLALALAAPRIRIQAPVPGRSYVGIEVPNTEISRVALREVLESEAFRKIKSSLKFALGKDVSGKPVCADLASMPHLLIAGTTNSGKSVCVNAILSCLLLNNTPDDLRLVLVDPKRVELTGYNGIPHLLGPVVVDAEKVVGALQWMLHEMDARYKRFAGAGARNITEYNKRGGEHLPFLVVVIDELADLMMLAPEETERSITRLAQLARATGIHLIIATQRPSVDVVTGLIKANFPARIAFAVASGVDSRVILDQPGAEKLLGKGDMLFQAPDASSPVRLQGAYVADGEIQRLVENWRLIAMNDSGNAQSTEQLVMDTGLPGGVPLKQGALLGDSDGQSADPMLAEAVELVRREGRASISMLQRRLRVGYTRAARLIDAMEDQGIIGPQVIGSQVREVLDYGQTVPPREE